MTPTFVPGPGDARALGAQVDVIELAPAGPGPRVALDLRPLVLLGVVVGAAMAALTLPWVAGTSLIVLMAVATACIITRGLGPFVPFPWLPIALGAFASAMVTTVALPARTTGGRLVVAITFMTVGLQLLLLTHPDMPINDAIFQTHRFQDVLGGHYLFASLAPGNYRFPYPIGLYLFARPFAAFAPTTADRMMLLRVIVVAVDACAAALLYRLVMRWRKDELEAVSSVVAYHLLPLGFGVIVDRQPDERVRAVAGDDHARRRRARRGRSGGRLGGDRGGRRPRGRGVPVAHEHVRGARHAARRGGRRARDRARAGVAAVRAPARRRGDRCAHLLDRACTTRTSWTCIERRSDGSRAKPDTRRPRPVGARRSRDSSSCQVDWWSRSACRGCCSRSPARCGSPCGRNRRPCMRLLAMWLAVCGFFMVVGIVTPVDLRHLLAALPVIGILIAIGFAAGWRSGPIGRALGIAAAAGWHGSVR